MPEATDSASGEETNPVTKLESDYANVKEALKQERDKSKGLQTELDALRHTSTDLAKQFESTKTEYDKAQAVLAEYDDYFKKTLEDATSKLPKEVLELIPSNYSDSQKLSWINKASEALKPADTGRNPTPRGIVNPSGKGERASITKEEFVKLSLPERAKHLEEARALRDMNAS